MMQIIPQTRSEKKAMYMKCTKSELAEMLIECNNHLERMQPQILNVPCVPVQPIITIYPQPAIVPYPQPSIYPPFYTTCETTSASN